MDGKRSGFGKMIYENIKTELGAIDSGVYEGYWLWGKRDGQGKMSWTDGSMFEGTWKGDERHYGTMIMIDQSMYKGYFKNELFDGEGELWLQSGITYIGKFEKGRCMKNGKLIFPNGNIYEG